MITLNDVTNVLDRTPRILRTLFEDLPESLVFSNEGPGTWTPFDVVGHLIHGDQTDWIPRTRIILKYGENQVFDAFDREGMFRSSSGKSIEILLKEFAQLREENLRILQTMALSPADLARKGMHPTLGQVTLEQHLATWAVHDLDHITQILRTIAKSHTSNVGPWKVYLSILTDRPVKEN